MKFTPIINLYYQLAATLFIGCCTGCSDPFQPLTQTSGSIRFTASLQDNPEPSSRSTEGNISLPAETTDNDGILVLLSGQTHSDSLYIHTSAAPTSLSPLTGPDTRAGISTTPISSMKVTAYTWPTGTEWNESSPTSYFNDITAYEPDWSIPYPWPSSNQQIRFFAYSPEETEATITLENNIPQLYYSLPDVERQGDLLVGSSPAVESDPSNTTPVPIHFKHILSAIRFVTGNDIQTGKIISISIKNVYNQGYYNILTGQWQTSGESIAEYSQELDRTLTDSTGSDAELIGNATAFMMLPQSFPTDASIEVIYQVDSHNIVLQAPLTGSWEPGYTYTYRISTQSVIEEKRFLIQFGSTPYQNDNNDTLTYEGLSESVPTYSISYIGGNFTRNITSDRILRKGSTIIKEETLGWDLMVSSDNGKTWNTPSAINLWLSFEASSDSYNANNTANIASQSEKLGTDEYLRNLPWAGNISHPVNLAASDNGNISTANCYIVHSRGNYQIPVVYGNSYRNGVINESVFQPNNSRYALKRPIDYQGNEINAPLLGSGFIQTHLKQKYNRTLSDAFVLWQDSPDLITDISLNDDCTYLSFKIGSSLSNMKQGNAVIAVTDNNHTIVWSWHIWITPLYLQNNLIAGNRLVQYPLGWIDYGTENYHPGRSILLKFTQRNTLATQYIRIRQREEYQPSYMGRCCFYQGGRKDPIPPAKWNDNTQATIYSGSSNTSPYFTSNRMSIQETLQYPYRFVKNAYSWMNDKYLNLWDHATDYATAINRNTSQNKSVTAVKSLYDPSPAGYQLPPPALFQQEPDYFKKHPIYTGYYSQQSNGYSSLDETAYSWTSSCIYIPYNLFTGDWGYWIRNLLNTSDSSTATYNSIGLPIFCSKE